MSERKYSGNSTSQTKAVTKEKFWRVAKALKYMIKNLFENLENPICSKKFTNDGVTYAHREKKILKIFIREKFSDEEKRIFLPLKTN